MFQTGRVQTTEGKEEEDGAESKNALLQLNNPQVIVKNMNMP